MQYKETNLNHYIKVKLTEKGKEIYRNRFDEDDIKELGIEYCEPKIDKDGYTEFQMWDFIRIFGKYFHMLGDNPCETKCMVQVKNDENNLCFEQWYESDEYEKDTKDVKLGITASRYLDDDVCEFKISNCKEFAQICFNKGLEKGKDKTKEEQLEKENKQLKELIKDLRKENSDLMWAYRNNEYQQKRTEKAMKMHKALMNKLAKKHTEKK